MATCAKCGTENVAGDAFCGGCGAFLEFAAEEAAEAAEDAAAAAGPEALPRPAEEAPADAAPAPPAAAAPEPARAATQPGPGPALGPTCSACGQANPTGRTFCVACGERLPAGGAAAGPSGARPSPTAPAPAGVPPAGPTSASGAAAPSPPARPAWDFPTGPVPAPAPAPAASRVSEPGGRSRLALIGVVVLVVAVLGGGAVLLLGGGLGGGTPGPGASAPPSITAASGDPSGGPTGEPASPQPASEPPGESTPPQATIPPGPSVGIKVTGAKASSQLASSRSPANLHDGSPATAWKSKSGAFEGAWVEVAFAPAAVTRIQIWGGWQRDEPFYYGNRRPRNVTVSFDDGDPVPLQLQDILGAQRVDIPPELGIVSATRLRITIADTYPGRKTSAGGSPTKEVAISEIRIFGVPVAP